MWPNICSTHQWKDRRKAKQKSSKNINTRRNISLAGKKHGGDVCGCKISQKVEGHDRLSLCNRHDN